jgi:hypothetical protein
VVPVSCAPQTGTARLDYRSVEAEWKQSSRKVLFPDAARTEATGKRNGKLEPDLDRDLRHCKAQGGVNMSFEQWLYTLPTRADPARVLRD